MAEEFRFHLPTVVIKPGSKQKYFTFFKNEIKQQFKQK